MQEQGLLPRGVLALEPWAGSGGGSGRGRDGRDGDDGSRDGRDGGGGGGGVRVGGTVALASTKLPRPCFLRKTLLPRLCCWLLLLLLLLDGRPGFFSKLPPIHAVRSNLGVVAPLDSGAGGRMEGKLDSLR